MKTIRKGSITVWLSLVLCVILALIFACLQSARLSAARAYCSVCIDESLFSEFARYDRILYENYGILAIDAGFGGGTTDLTAVANEIDEAARTLLATQKDLFRIGFRETDLTGFVRATDSDAAPLKQQIAKLMTAKLGVDGTRRLVNMVNTYAPVIEQQEGAGTVDPETIGDAYAKQREQAAERKAEVQRAEAQQTELQPAEAQQTELQPAEAQQTEVSGITEETTPVEVPEDFKNPLDNIESIIRMGVYNTILPDPLAVSGQAIDRNTLAEKRTFEEGMGILPGREENAAEHFLTAAYINDFFPDFLTEKNFDQKGIRYQVEFAIAGKGSDAENLKSVLNRILLLRMGLNYVYLNLMDPVKKAEAEACALIIATILLMPEQVEGITQLVLLAWAYGESMMDVKTLLAGGKEPLIKDESSWQLTLSQLASFSSETPVTSLSGLSYDDHLTILLCMRSGDEITDALLDLLEYNRRLLGDDPSFRIDSCLTAIETETLLTLDDQEYSITRGYGYDQFDRS